MVKINKKNKETTTRRDATSVAPSKKFKIIKKDNTPLPDKFLPKAKLKKLKSYKERKQDINESISEIVQNDKTPNKLALRRLLDMTAFMENSYGADSTAYNRNYTSSQMSLDDPALNNLLTKPTKDIIDKKTGEVIGKEEVNYTNTQTDYFNKMKDYGFTKENIVDSLKADNPMAAVFMARFQYGKVAEPLPSGNNYEDYYNYYQNHYKVKGTADKKRFKDGWNLMMKGEFNK